MDRSNINGAMIEQIDLRNVPHSAFDRSNHNYLTGKLGKIIPTRIDEVYPGDRIKGRPSMVVNFEPLAAPIMGSMVLKQEAFFVPYHLVWRNAYKFFTGKNGFANDMPKISPRRVFRIIFENLFQYLFDTTVNPAVGSLITRMQSVYSHIVDDAQWNTGIFLSDYFDGRDNIIYNFEHLLDDGYYSQYGMRDLVQPMLDMLYEFRNSSTYGYYAERFAYPQAKYEYDENNMLTDLGAKEAKEDLLAFAKAWFYVYERAFMYVFGPSSLCDYIGWPCVVECKTDQGFDIFEDWVTATIIGIEVNSLYERLIPLFSQIPLNWLVWRAYYLVWYWNYRDQLLEVDAPDPESDDFMSDSVSDQEIVYLTLLRVRCWLKDTFTTALTNTGDANLSVPTLKALDSGSIVFSYYSGQTLVNTKDAHEALRAGATVCKITMPDSTIEYSVPMNYLTPSFSNSNFTDQASDFVSLDLFDRIKRLRSFVQKKLILGYEVDDVIYSSFMVKLSNVRMHVPELLGRGRDAIQINTVVNNTSTSEQIAGDKTATAWAQGSMSEINYFAEEWGFYIQLATVMPIQSYAGGLQRHFLKVSPFDYAWPEFATMGMDAVYNTELASIGERLSDVDGMAVFGYQGRYYDLKSRHDEEHGRLLTDLNYLTFSREFDKNNPPRLNYAFVHCWPRLDAFVMDDPNEDVFRADCYTAQGWERRFPVPSEIVG